MEGTSGLRSLTSILTEVCSSQSASDTPSRELLSQLQDVISRHLSTGQDSDLTAATSVDTGIPLPASGRVWTTRRGRRSNFIE